MNYRLVKEYLNEKGCTCGYNKVGKKDEDKNIPKLNNIIKYINNLHIEFDAFYNYKKKSKNLKGDMFVEYLEEKKKNMVINSNIEKEDYTTLSHIVNKNLIPIDKILSYKPSLDFSYIIQGIKHNNFIKTSININELQDNDWYEMYIYHKNKKNKSSEKKIKNSSILLNQNFINNEHNNNIIRLTSSSKYKINEKPSTYASTIFQYSEQFISNNDIYTFADNINKKREHFLEHIKTKQHKCRHNFYHILSKVETYMNWSTEVHNIHNNNDTDNNNNNNNNMMMKTKKKDVEKQNEERDKEYYHFYHYINEAMNLLYNKPYDIEMFQYKYFYNFLQSLEKKKKKRKKEKYRMDNKRKVDNKLIAKQNNKIDNKSMCDDHTNNNRKDNSVSRENYVVDKCKAPNNVDKDYIYNSDDIDNIKDNFITLIDYIHYDYSIYQEEFLTSYYNNIYSSLEEDDIYLDEDTHKLYIKEIIKNINKNCNKLIQIYNKIQKELFYLEHIDLTRIKLFCEFNDIVTAYIQPHNGIIHITNYKQNIRNTESILDKWGIQRKIKKINLENNFLFNISIDNEKENNLIITNITGGNNIKNDDDNNNNNNMSHINMTKKRTPTSLSHSNNKKDVTTDNYKSSEFFEDVNLDILEEKININEFFILNNISLYNNIVHIYKNGKFFFPYEQLRAVFWIWIQSLFSDISYLERDVEEEELKEKENKNIHVDFFDI
ncbi:hypothetical protein PFMALIP_01695 [Plasmodium falciparum MaliPS096_E11]|uniref:Uncharacterized protein n=1 Tax=Plasmodium falciparum MaliPS096_E11 TaxID=1036727 RepID=A0A024WTH4_PLAFA|nr:hypothetical protein PFMALIP_01695 [Plasmodium falciparum MaliPS096_E11]